MKHRTRQGRIEYLTAKPGFPNGLWGFEDWSMTHHGDGMRVLRARCELHDEPPLIRDVIQAVDAEFHPHDVYVRLTIDDKFFGSTWYHFSDTEAEYEGFTAKNGRIRDKRPITRAIRGFGTHPVTADAWLAARFDYSKGPGIQTFKNNLLSSIDHRGATGPAFETTTSSLQYFGTEEISVRAGTYPCHHLAFVNTSNNHPAYDFWITADGDFLFVKGVVAEPYLWTLELIEDIR